VALTTSCRAPVGGGGVVVGHLRRVLREEGVRLDRQVVDRQVRRLERERLSYEALDEWFRLFLRFALAAQMFYFGMAKVIPTQFPPPSLVTLVEPALIVAFGGLVAFVAAALLQAVYSIRP